MRTLDLHILPQVLRSTLNTLHGLTAAVSATFKSRAALQLEKPCTPAPAWRSPALRESPKLAAADRFLWAWLCAVWSGWRSALVIVKPDTVIAWHRKGFRLFWTWKVGRVDWGGRGLRKTYEN